MRLETPGAFPIALTREPKPKARTADSLRGPRAIGAFFGRNLAPEKAHGAEIQ